MAKRLVIVESPAKAKTINKILGPDFDVTSSMGHLRDLPASRLGVDVEHDFAPHLSSSRSGASSPSSSRRRRAAGRRST